MILSNLDADTNTGVYLCQMAHFKYRPMPPLTKELNERFWKKVQQAGEDECWFWAAAYGRGGYGQFTISGKHLKRDTPYGAHRVAYFLHYGVDPKDLFVCHKCDNPKCCNPKHLFLGTNQENTQDRQRKGRFACGEKCSTGRTDIFSKTEVQEILNRYWGGETSTSISADYEVSQQTISDIIRGRSYKYVTREKPHQPKWMRLGKLTPEQIISMRQRYEKGEGITALAREFQITHAAAGRIVRKETYRNI